MTHLDKLIQATLSHRDMRHAMSKRSLELAAEREEQREQLARQLIQDGLQGGDSGSDTSQAAGD